MIRLAAVACCLVALLAGHSSASSGYSYYGTHVGPTQTRVSLDTATVGIDGGHAAVWLGASVGVSAWVQGGVAYMGVQPFIYIEFKRWGHNPCLVSWPVAFGKRVDVRIEDHSARWRVLVGGHLSRSILMLHPALISTLEIYADASGSGTIGTRRVTS